MACSVFDAFAIATESLSDEVYRNASYRSVWLNAIPRGTFQTGAGTLKTTFTIENSEPTSDSETWDQITNTSTDLLVNESGPVDGGTCASTFNDVYVGYSTRTYNPESFALQGPIICKDDLIYDHNVDVFLRAYIEEMTKRAQRSWEKRYENLYMKFASKVAVGNTNSIVDTENDITALTTLGDATSALTQQYLDQIAVELIDRGATNPDSNGFITFGEDGPVFPLLVGLEASQQIALNNSELRNDFRHAQSGAGATAELMSRLGATRSIKNFRHIPNLRPPRFTYDGGTGQYTRVATYTMPDAVGGKKAVLNPAYIAAPYEAAIVLNPSVFTSEIVPPVNAAGGLSWNPTSYMGEWKWVTGGSKIKAAGDCLDPLDKLGRHFAEFKHAPRPEFPTYGMTLIFKRACGVGSALSGTDVTTCSS